MGEIGADEADGGAPLLTRLPPTVVALPSSLASIIALKINSSFMSKNCVNGEIVLGWKPKRALRTLSPPPNDRVNACSIRAMRNRYSYRYRIVLVSNMCRAYERWAFKSESQSAFYSVDAMSATPIEKKYMDDWLPFEESKTFQGRTEEKISAHSNGFQGRLESKSSTGICRPENIRA